MRRTLGRDATGGLRHLHAACDRLGSDLADRARQEPRIRCDQTGAPYVYAGATFGSLAGAATGWVLWFARVTGCCAICNLLLDYLGYFDSGWSQGLGRMATAVAIIGGLSLIHYLGVRLTALFGNVFTIGKLLPLLVFIGFGLAHIDIAQFPCAAIVVSNQHFAEAVLFLSFAFVDSSRRCAVTTTGSRPSSSAKLSETLNKAAEPNAHRA